MHCALRTAIRASILIPLACATLAGCTDADPDDADAWAIPSSEPLPVEVGRHTMGEFVAHISPRDGHIEIRPLDARGAPLLHTESQLELPVASDGVAGTNPLSTVELVTNSVLYDASCPSKKSGRWCASVTLRHFFLARSFNNVYVQVTKITDANGKALSGHQGSNSAAPLSWPGNYAIDNVLGLWSYGSLGPIAPANEGTMSWEFLNPDNADTYVYLRVVASPTYTTYLRQASTETYVDACTVTGGVNLGTGTTYTTVTAPFPFSIFGATSPKLNVVRGGQLTVGDDAPMDSGSTASFSLPSKSAPFSGIFAYWDTLNFGNSPSKHCYVVQGSAPNRKIVFTWKEMKIFGQSSAQYNMTFDAILSEGSDRIDFVYYNMTTTNAAVSYNQARVNGSKAVIGLQNETGTVAVDGLVGLLAVNSGGTCTNGVNCQKFAYVPVF